MSQIEIIQIIEQIKQEITIDSNGHGKATIRATARLADVQDSSLRRALLSAALEPSTLAQSLMQHGFEPAALETWNQGIPDMGVAAVIEYYALNGVIAIVCMIFNSMNQSDAYGGLRLRQFILIIKNL